MSNTTMNETKHTPGPWFHNAHPYTDQDSYVLTGDKKERIADVFLFTGDFGSMRLRSKEETEANARLIAASPELLAACQEAVRYLGEHHGSTIMKLRRAIDKATGSQTAPQPTGGRVPDDVIDWDGPDREQP